MKLSIKRTYDFDKLAKKMQKIMDRHTDRIGRVSVQGIKDVLDSGKLEKISEATKYVRKEGLSPNSNFTATPSTKPLVHTGKFRRSIKWVSRGIKGIAGEDYGIYHLKERKIRNVKFAKRMNFGGKTRPARNYITAALKNQESNVLKSFHAFRKEVRKALKK